MNIDDHCSGKTLFSLVLKISEADVGDGALRSFYGFCPSPILTNEGTCEASVPLRMHYEETKPSNANPIFLMIQIVLALVVPKSPLPERLSLSPLCNPSSRPS